MTNIQKTGGSLLTMAIIITISALITIFQVHIIYDIAALYNLILISILPVEVLYGILFVISIIRLKVPKQRDLDETKDMDELDKFKRSLNKQGTTAIIYLVFWGIVHLFHMIAF